MSEEERGRARCTVAVVSLYIGMAVWMIGAGTLETFAEALGASNLMLLSQAWLLVSIWSVYRAVVWCKRHLGIPSTLVVSFIKPGTKEYERLMQLANDRNNQVREDD